jgi:hypothetical protein
MPGSSRTFFGETPVGTYEFIEEVNNPSPNTLLLLLQIFDLIVCCRLSRLMRRAMALSTCCFNSRMVRFHRVPFVIIILSYTPFLGPVPFDNGLGYFAGYWDTLEIKNIGVYETYIYWNIYACFTGKPAGACTTLTTVLSSH